MNRDIQDVLSKSLDHFLSNSIISVGARLDFGLSGCFAFLSLCRVINSVNFVS